MLQPSATPKPVLDMLCFRIVPFVRPSVIDICEHSILNTTERISPNLQLSCI